MEKGKIVVEFTSGEFGENSQSSCSIQGNMWPVTLCRQFVRLLGVAIGTTIKHFDLDEEGAEKLISILFKETLRVKDTVVSGSDDDESDEDDEEDYEDESEDEDEVCVDCKHNHSDELDKSKNRIDKLVEEAKKFFGSDFFKESVKMLSKEQQEVIAKKQKEMFANAEKAKEISAEKKTKTPKKSDKEWTINDLMSFLKKNLNLWN